MYFGWEKSPCGSALGHTELRKYMFYAFKTQKQRFLFIKYRRCNFAGKKDPAGAHLDTPSLESTCFIYLRRKNRGSENLYL